MIARRSFLISTLFASAAALAAPALLAQPRNAPRDFRVGYQKGGIFSLVRERRAFEKRLAGLGVESIKWIEFPFGPPLLEALGVGSVDIGAVDDTPPIFAQSAGAEIVYVASAPATQSAVLVPRTSDINGVGALKGRKVAIAKGSSSHNFTIQALAKYKLAFSDIEPVYLAPADAIAAFARGSVDAWTVWDPYFALAEQLHGARAIITTSDVAVGQSFYIANRTFANAYPGVLVAALEELVEVYRWAAGHRQQLAELISSITGVDLKAQQRAVDRARIEGHIGLSPDLIVQQQEIADTFFRLGLIPRAIKVQDAVWMPPRA